MLELIVILLFLALFVGVPIIFRTARKSPRLAICSSRTWRRGVVGSSTGGLVPGPDRRNLHQVLGRPTTGQLLRPA